MNVIADSTGVEMRAGVCRGEHGPIAAPSAQPPTDRVDASVVLLTGRVLALAGG